MKNNRVITILLLAVVGFIWYKVFFRVKDSLFAEDVEVVQPNESQDQYKAVKRDTVQLALDYRDPFGETEQRISLGKPEEPKPNPPVVRNQPPKPQFQWPNIEYFGMLRKTTSTDPLAIIGIDGFKHHMRKGEKVYDGVTIKTIGRDSVVIYYQKKSKVFWRN